MIANYHTHTWRCNHASGQEEAYVQTAIAQEFKILGFADHTPYYFPGNYYSTFRMRPEQLTGYCETVRGLRKKYDGQIHIPLGLELEYYPNLLPQLLPVLRDQGIEYLLLGQHFIGDEIGEHYSGSATDDPHILNRYARQCMDAMQTGLFTYLAHPDLIHFMGDDKTYRQAMRPLCKEARSCGIPLEINMLGIWSGRQYPANRFWDIAAEEGCRVVIGCDAHAPEQLVKPDAEQRALEIVRHYGLQLLQTVELKAL